jgi:hypothetical protein
MPTMVTRLVTAMNSRDAGRVAALFAEDYQSAQPVHPSRGFGGSAQVLEELDGCLRRRRGFRCRAGQLVDLWKH